MGGERFADGSPFFPFASFQRSARLLILAVFLDGVAVAFLQLFLNFYILARGYGLDFLGLANSAPAVATLALGIPLGRFADRVGFQKSMLLGIASAYAGFCGMLFAASPAVLLAGMALTGAGSCLFYLSVNPFLMKHSGAGERPLLFSTNVGLQILAGAAGSLIAGQLPAGFNALFNLEPGSAESYRTVLLVGAICGFLALAPLLMMKHVPSASGSAPSFAEGGAPVWSAGEKNLLLKMITPNLLIGLGAAMLIPYLNLFLRQRFSVSDSLLGMIFSVSAVCTGSATFLSPWVAGRLGSRIRAIIATQAGSLVFLLVLGFSPWFPVAAAAFFFRAGMMNMSIPLYSSFCMEQTAEGKRGLASSLIQMALQGGWAVGPFLSGFIQGRWGFPPLFVATAVLYAAAILFVRAFFLKLENPVPAAAVG
ncbi:MAG: MFS transporter [Anaerolineales bacterium]|nr:MFS transporter [Anaerolineales bacterium]